MKIIVLLTFLLFISCDNSLEGDIEQVDKTLYIYADYTNTPVNGPKLSIDREMTSDWIRFSDTTYVNILDNRVNIVIPSVKIENEIGVFAIETAEDIKVEEFQEDDWDDQTYENPLFAYYEKAIDLVLVLDVSSSLGEDVSNVKSYASTFVEAFYETIPDARVGIVGFSDTIYKLGLTRHLDSCRNFIKSLAEDANETKLYEAMGSGLDLLEFSENANRVIITFTDGSNNGHYDSKYRTADYLISRLVDNEIASYTIGLTGRGGIDDDKLKSLANDGIFAKADAVSDLQNIFDVFTNSVASTYYFVYERNISEYIEPLKLKFTIQTKLQ